MGRILAEWLARHRPSSQFVGTGARTRRLAIFLVTQCPGHEHRVNGACGVASRAFASLDMVWPRPEGWQLLRRTGEDEGTAISPGRTALRRAMNVPLIPVTKGLSRSRADTPNRRSGHMEAETAQIPKLIARASWRPARWSRL